jgi:LysR family transcriptional regulator, nod-box dependent transcriptional activator
LFGAGSVPGLIISFSGVYRWHKTKMQLSHLDLNLLIALDALLTERNITAAGRRVHLTQSAMSGALSRLREYFGDELLTPVGRKMVRTPMGDSLASPVRSILLQIKETITVIPSFDPATSQRKFSLMMSDYVSTVLMPAVLSRVEESAPTVGFEILSNDFSHPLEILERADVDFIIMPPAYLLKSHPSARLFDDDYACVVWSENDLVGDSITPEQYLRLGHVSLQFGRAQTPVVDAFIESEFGDARRIEVVAMNFNAVLQYIVGTRRIAIIQKRLAAYYAKYHPIRLIPPPFAIPQITETLQWHTCFDKDPGSLWLRGVLQETAGQVELS